MVLKRDKTKQIQISSIILDKSVQQSTFIHAGTRKIKNNLNYLSIVKNP